MTDIDGSDSTAPYTSSKRRAVSKFIVRSMLECRIAACATLGETPALLNIVPNLLMMRHVSQQSHHSLCQEPHVKRLAKSFMKGRAVETSGIVLVADQADSHSGG